MRGLKFGAISVGAIVDIVTSLLLGFVFMTVVLFALTAQGAAMPDAVAELDYKMHHSMIMLLASLGLGALGSLTGGFVAGWMAKTHRVLNGAATGIVSTLIGLMFWGQDPAWFDLLGVVCTIGPTTSGAYLSDLVFGSHPSPPAPPIIIHP